MWSTGSLVSGFWALASVVSASKYRYTCELLAEQLPGDVSFSNSSMYVEENNFWSNRQREVHPDCFVAPRNATAVSTVMKILTRSETLFTVKSGGHTSFPGGSNIEDGITVDLMHLNDIVVADDRQTVSVGPGNRWIDVSTILDPLGLAVVGGRVADVGTSGLILGGGISYFSGRYGWACDNVRAFEIVLSSGEVTTASPTKNPDLYRALRGGGGSNFGIVTKFDLVAFPQRDIWASTSLYPGAMNTTLVPLFVDLALNGLPSDKDAHTYFVTSHQASFGGYFHIASFYHATPPPQPNATPEFFKPFQGVPSISSRSVVTNLSSQSMAIDQPYGSRQTWWDTTVKLVSSNLFVDVIPLWQAYADRLIAAAAATNSKMQPYLIFQPISTNIIEVMQKNGGNALGLSPDEGPLMIVQLSATWDDPTLDGLVEESCARVIKDVNELSKRKGMEKGLVYMNYGGKTQDVLKSYGTRSYEQLKKTAKKYDPEGKLQRLWKGYFQLN